MNSDEYQQIQEGCREPAQERYESIRPLVLFDDELSIQERASQTGHDRRTIRRRVDVGA